MVQIKFTVREPRFRPPLSGKHLLAVGAVAAEYSQMAFAVDMTTWRMLGLPAEDGRTLTCGLAFERKANKLDEVAGQ